MKKAALSFLGMLLISAGSLFAEENFDGLEIWYGGGYNDGDVTFQESQPGFSRSKVEFEAKGAYYLGGGLRYQFVNSDLPRLSMTLEGFVSRSNDGTAKDSDWLVSSNNVWIYSESDEEADQNSCDFNFGWKMLDAANGVEKLDFLIGYFQDSYDFEVNNINTQIYDYDAINDVCLGHASNFETRLRGYYFGLDNAVSFFSNKLRINASIKYIPDLRGEGDGEWELRNLEFHQEGYGDGYKAALGVTVKPFEGWTFGLKVTKTDLEVDGHVDNTYIDANWQDLGVTDLDFIKAEGINTEARIGYRF